MPFIACIGALMGVYITVSGSQIFIAGLLMLGIAPVAVFWRHHAKAIRATAFAFVAAALLTVIVDTRLGGVDSSTARALANYALTATGILTLSYLVRGRERAGVALLVGFSCGWVGSSIFQPTYFVAADIWKYGVATPLTILAFLLVRRRGSLGGLVQSLLVIGLAGIHLVLGFRSMAALTIFALVLFLIRGRKPLSSGRLVVVGLTFVLGVIAISSAYQTIASSGILGEDARYKMESQAGNFGPLLGGRKELFFTSHAIADSPLVGHGTDPQMSLLAKEEVRAEILDSGYEWTALDSAIYLNDLSIPTHSALFGGWVEVGPLGALPWMFVLGIAVAFYRRPTLGPAQAVGVFLAVDLTWNALFSPYGGINRPLLAVTVVALASFTSRSDLSDPNPSTLDAVGVSHAVR